MKDKYRALALILVFCLIISLVNYTYAQPSGANITYNNTEIKDPAPADYLNTSGGSFTTIILEGETQNLRWKAYAGNVSGALVLDDAANYSIYQWSVSSITGEVYASRSGDVTWTSIGCADDTDVFNEHSALNHSNSSEDNINNTFIAGLHKSFYVGSVPIGQSACKSTFTWANDTAQTPALDAPFQEVLLHDGTNLVYTTFIDDNTQGFNYKDYDFQMIVAERGIGGYSNTPYYFYVELQ